MQALLQAIDRQREADPLIGAKVGAKEVYGRVIQALQGERGVHIETLLGALAALAGYACQAGVHAQRSDARWPDPEPLTVVESVDGRQFFFGNAINAAMAENEHSVWSLAADAAQHAGAGADGFPDLAELFRHVAGSVGTPEFGVPRVPAEHCPGLTPLECLETMWAPLLPIVTLFCPDPRQWHVLYALAVQEAIGTGKQVLDPATALRLVMECAVPMSKVTLRDDATSR